MSTILLLILAVSSLSILLFVVCAQSAEPIPHDEEF